MVLIHPAELEGEDHLDGAVERQSYETHAGSYREAPMGCLMLELRSIGQSLDQAVAYCLSSIARDSGQLLLVKAVWAGTHLVIYRSYCAHQLDPKVCHF